ncbi:MAG: Excisionase/Xis, DNA-binding, partial [uncultured Frankineae bacterium]
DGKPLPAAHRRRGDPQHLLVADLRPGAVRGAAGDQDRWSRAVAGGAHGARGLHPALLRRDPGLRHRTARVGRRGTARRGTARRGTARRATCRRGTARRATGRRPAAV